MFIMKSTGTDSRFGVGFRLGEHADFQILIELGPQTDTDPIGTSNDAKRRRDVRICIICTLNHYTFNKKKFFFINRRR